MYLHHRLYLRGSQSKAETPWSGREERKDRNRTWAHFFFYRPSLHVGLFVKTSSCFPTFSFFSFLFLRLCAYRVPILCVLCVLLLEAAALFTSLSTTSRRLSSFPLPVFCLSCLSYLPRFVSPSTRRDLSSQKKKKQLLVVKKKISKTRISLPKGFPLALVYYNVLPIDGTTRKQQSQQSQKRGTRRLKKQAKLRFTAGNKSED